MTKCATKPIVSERNKILNPGAQAHCKRVAAWCEELALALDLPAEDTDAMHEAALMHHHPIGLLHGSGYAKLAGELGCLADAIRESNAPKLISAEAEEILQALQGNDPYGTSQEAQEMAHILKMANCFDERIESSSLKAELLQTILQRALEGKEESDQALQFVLRYLRKAEKTDLDEVIPRLPVYPAVAMKLYRMLSADDVSLMMLEAVAKTDQVIAGKMLQAANSAFYSPRQSIKTVSQAIGYIGIDDSRRILLASAVQPLFSSPRLSRIWKHAVQAAQVAEQIARLSEKVDPAEGFLIGLVHDVGKLAITLMSSELNSSLDRLVLKGCESTIAEIVVCGFDHAEAGAEVLSHWKFSSEVVSAVRHHHTPEKTGDKLAAILYLTEFWTDSEEDIPSDARLEKAFEVAGIAREDLENMTFEFNEAMPGL